jgi:predicted phosphodiesterase/transposase-like protein
VAEDTARCGGKLEPGWYQDEQALRRELAAHGSLAAAANAHGSEPGTLSKWWRRFGGEVLPTGRAAPSAKRYLGTLATGDTADLDERLLGALKRLGDTATVEDIADTLDVSPRRIRETLDKLGLKGYRVSEDASTVRLERHPTETGETHPADASLFDGDTFRFGVTSDIHTSSIAERLDAWEAAYDIFEQEGVRAVYDPGDLCDGLGIYRGQVSEVKHHTYEAQVDYAVDRHPRRDGITTYRISGNHDLEGEIGRIGADPVQAVANVRDDIQYLGRYSASVELPNGARMHLLHPMGGASYAASYRPQKIVESYEGGAKPNILLIGHYHRAGYFSTRGVQVLLAGTFQGPTTYSIRKAFGEPGFGFWIVECRLAEDASVVRFRPEWFPIYPGRTA